MHRISQDICLFFLELFFIRFNNKFVPVTESLLFGCSNLSSARKLQYDGRSMHNFYLAHYLRPRPTCISSIYRTYVMFDVKNATFRVKLLGLGIDGHVPAAIFYCVPSAQVCTGSTASPGDLI